MWSLPRIDILIGLVFIEILRLLQKSLTTLYIRIDIYDIIVMCKKEKEKCNIFLMSFPFKYQSTKQLKTNRD